MRISFKALAVVSLLLVGACAAQVDGPAASDTPEDEKGGVTNVSWRVEAHASGGHCLVKDFTDNRQPKREQLCGDDFLVTQSLAREVLPGPGTNLRVTPGDTSCASWRAGAHERSACGPRAIIAEAVRLSAEEATVGLEDAVARRVQAAETGAKVSCWVHNVSVVSGVAVATKALVGWAHWAAWSAELTKTGWVASAASAYLNANFWLQQIVSWVGLGGAYLVGVADLFIWIHNRLNWDNLSTLTPQIAEGLWNIGRNVGGREHYLSWLYERMGIDQGADFTLLCTGPALGD